MTKVTEEKTLVERAAALSDEALKSGEAGRRDAIEAVRKFVDTLEEAIPALVDPALRRQVVDAALDLADRLVTTQTDFVRGVARTASGALTLGRHTKK